MKLISRVVMLLADPSTEWTRIEKEPVDTAYLFTSYVALLALVPAVFGFIGICAIGAIVPGQGLVRAPLVNGLLGAVLGYVMSCATVLALGVLLELLAPAFGVPRNFDKAVKLAVYSYTPVWLAGFFLLAPGLRFLCLTSLYGGFVLWTGLPQLMNTPVRSAPIYTVVIVVAGCALTLATAAAQRALFYPPGF